MKHLVDLFNNLEEENKNDVVKLIYIHCKAGCDRTGKFNIF